MAKKFVGYQAGPRMFDNWEEANKFAEACDFPMPENVYEEIEEETTEEDKETEFPVHEAWANGKVEDLFTTLVGQFNNPKLSENRRKEITAALVWSMWSKESQKLEAMVRERDYSQAELYDACYAEELENISTELIALSGSRTIIWDVEDKAWVDWQ
jgi:hypothetical protein